MTDRRQQLTIWTVGTLLWIASIMVIVHYSKDAGLWLIVWVCVYALTLPVASEVLWSPFRKRKAKPEPEVISDVVALRPGAIVNLHTVDQLTLALMTLLDDEVGPISADGGVISWYDLAWSASNLTPEQRDAIALLDKGFGVRMVKEEWREIMQRQVWEP